MRDLLRGLIVSLTLLGLVAALPVAASAQGDAGSVPGAVDCTVEPRTEEEILNIVASATPVTGENDEEAREAELKEWDGVEVVGPASFETQEAIRSTMWQLFACLNADMPLHRFALVTDDLIANNPPSIEELRGEDPTDEVVDGEVIEQGPTALLDVVQVQMLSNGQAVAVVLADSTDRPMPVEAYAFYFEEVDGRWLLDGAAL